MTNEKPAVSAASVTIFHSRDLSARITTVAPGEPRERHNHFSHFKNRKLLQKLKSKKNKSLLFVLKNCGNFLCATMMSLLILLTLSVKSLQSPPFTYQVNISFEKYKYCVHQKLIPSGIYMIRFKVPQ